MHLGFDQNRDCIGRRHLAVGCLLALLGLLRVANMKDWSRRSHLSHP